MTIQAFVDGQSASDAHRVEQIPGRFALRNRLRRPAFISKTIREEGVTGKSSFSPACEQGEKKTTKMSSRSPIAIVVHGGAWNIPQEIYSDSEKGAEEAAKAGYQVCFVFPRFRKTF